MENFLKQEGKRMEFRKARPEDSSALTALRIDMRRERETPPPDFDFQNFYNNTLQFFEENIKNESFAAFIAEEKGEIIASSGVTFYKVPPTFRNISGKTCYLMNMYTKPEFRKIGIATKLLHFTVEEAKNRQCKTVSLSASDMGRPVYLKFGFTIVDNEMVYDINS